MSDPKPHGAKTIIYKSIRAEIINGRKKPGERLSIDQLKTAFGTSVTPVRDALQMLSQEELITIKPRSGYYVTQVTLKKLNDMMDLRHILELAAVERACARITDRQIQELEQIHQGYTDDDDTSYVRYTEENRAFHVTLARASGNQELADQLAHLHDRLARFMVLSNSGKLMIPTHGKLLQFLKARDTAGALRTMKKELEGCRLMIMDRIMQEEAGYWHL